MGQLLLSILAAPGCHISPNVRTDTLIPVQPSSQHHTLPLLNPVPDPENTAMNKMTPHPEPSSPLSRPHFLHPLSSAAPVDTHLQRVGTGLSWGARGWSHQTAGAEGNGSPHMGRF